MTPGLLYAFGTLAVWIGWAAVFLTLYRLVALLLLPRGAARAAQVAAIAWSAVTAAFFLLLSEALPMHSRAAQGALSVPIFWPILPFACWAALACVFFVAYRAFQLLTDRSAHQISLRQRRAWVLQAVVGMIFAAVFFTLFRLSGDALNIATGSVPLSVSVAGTVVALAAAAIIVMALSARAASRRGWGKSAALHVALLAGSVVFGLPFFWLVVTSFKEDIDMSSAHGLVWIPKVSETVPYRDPLHPYYKARFQGETVYADLIQRERDGRLKLNVSHPYFLLGQTFEAYPSQLQEVPRPVPVVKGNYVPARSRSRGIEVTGEVIEELNDGNRRVLISSPSTLKGISFVASPSELQPVRHIGLKWQNYPEALEYLPPEAEYGFAYLRNTLILVVFNVIGTIASSSLVAYAFARMRFPGRNLLFLILLSTMMLPAAVTLLPTFLIFRSLGWIDTLYPLWVPAFFASAFNVFLLRQFFLTIPQELEDAAKIDGCSHPRTFWWVMLPQVKPALAVITIWTFMGVWNNFMGPLVYISTPERMTVSYAVQLFQSDRSGEPGLMMAFATMSMIPVLVLFFSAQKYFIEGVTITGLGGR